MNIEAAEKATILKILAGSHIHGLNVETSDRDEEAIVIESIDEAMGLGNPFEELIYESPEVDKKYVSLRKWCRLACKGNPNFLLPLFAPLDSIISMDARGSQLRDLASAFISKQAIKAHLGYMQGQRHRMQTGSHGGRGKPRQDKIDEFGYDTKYGMHLLRLSWQGMELARTGRLTLPIQDDIRKLLLMVRHGEYSLKTVLAIADEWEGRLKESFNTCDLPDEPAYNIIEKWMLNMYVRKWSADRASQDLKEGVGWHGEQLT